jgi:hypothetical protein
MSKTYCDNIEINESVPATGNYTYTYVSPAYVRSVRAQYTTKGANTTAKLQGSIDGTTYEDIQTIAAGFNAKVAVFHPYLRVSLDNTDASPEANELHLMSEWEKGAEEIQVD